MDDPRFFLDGASEEVDERTRRTARIRARFLEALRETGAVYTAAKKIGAGRTQVYKWRKEEPEFARAWDEAVQDCVELMEATFYQRGIAGEFQHGHKWLMAMAPERWAWRLKLEQILDQGIAEIAQKHGVSPERVREVAGIVGTKNGRNGNGQAI